MSRLLLIALGGGFGAVARYLLGGVVQRAMGAGFPYGTLVVNVLGCLLIGLLFPPCTRRTTLSAFVLIGALGGFTTFSTFSYETFRLANDGEFLRAFLNVVLSVTLGFGAVLIGYRLAERYFGVTP